MPFLTRARADAWNLLALPMLLFFLLPLAALFLRLSPASLIQVMRQPAAWQAVRVSLTTSLLSLAVTVILGLPLAWLLQRQRSRLSSLLELLVDLPTVLPPAAAGLALLMAFGRTGLVGSWLTPLGIQIPFTAAAVIMAQTLSPRRSLCVQPPSAGGLTVTCAGPRRWMARRWQIFRLLMLPLARGVSAAPRSLGRSLGEFGATILLRQLPRPYTDHAAGNLSRV